MDPARTELRKRATRYANERADDDVMRAHLVNAYMAGVDARANYEHVPAPGEVWIATVSA